jgi:hypothetical protein
MPDNDFKYKEVLTGLPVEAALDVASTLANIFPGLGSAVGNVLAGLSVGRKIGRVEELLQCLGEDLRDFRSEVSERYIKTDEFEELLENVLRKAAEERNEQKRRLLRAFLVAVIQHPRPYDDQKPVLRLLDAVDLDHIRMLSALAQHPRPDETNGLVGSIIGTLQRRLPSYSEQNIKELVMRLNDLRIIDLTANRMHTMMTPDGAADLRSTISPLGERFLAFIKS